MAQFEELQALWQRQPQRAASARDIAAVKQSLRGYGRHQSRVYLVKLALIAVILAVCFPRTHGSVAPIAALTAAAVLAGILLFLDLRNKRAIARLDFSEVSVAFVRRAIAQLSKERDPFGNFFWLLAVFLAVLENVVIAIGKHPATGLSRAGWHLFATAFAFAALELGRRVRIWRFNRECRPIIDRLSAIQRELEESSE